MLPISGGAENSKTPKQFFYEQPNQVQTEVGSFAGLHRFQKAAGRLFGYSQKVLAVQTSTD